VIVKQGSRWGTADRKHFLVLSVTEIDGHTWVHYREDRGIKVPAIECKEYSCYLESFVQRFSPLPE
jgi:hypothetical protein